MMDCFRLTAGFCRDNAFRTAAGEVGQEARFVRVRSFDLLRVLGTLGSQTPGQASCRISQP